MGPRRDFRDDGSAPYGIAVAAVVSLFVWWLVFLALLLRAL